MELELPDKLTRYFTAQNEHNVDGMTDCFALDAIVRDEGQTYSGRSAIRQWKRDTVAKYGISVQPLRTTAKPHGLIVVANVEGNFPGSPVNLAYDFTLDSEGLIRTLEIH